MRKGLSIAVLVLAIVAASCSNPEKNKLKFRPEAGQTRTAIIDQNTVMSMSMMGQNMNNTSNLNQRFMFAVEEVAPDGTTTVKATIDKITIAMSNSMLAQAAAMSGGKIPADMGAGELNTALESLKDKSFTFKVLPTGEVTDLQGLDALRNDFSGALTNPQLAGQNNYMFADEQTKYTLQDFFVQAPDEPMSQGKTWTEQGTDIAAMGIPFDHTDTCTVTKWDDASGAIEVKSDYNITATAEQLRKGMGLENMPGGEMFQMTMTMNGSTTGNTTVDRPSGWISAREESGTLNGNMEMSMAGQKMSMPVSLEIKTRFETLAK